MHGGPVTKKRRLRPCARRQNLLAGRPSVYHVLMVFRLALAAILVLPVSPAGLAQVLDFESGGLKYKALSRNGVTVMYAALPTRVHDLSALQVSVSNGSQTPWTIKPDDFRIEHDGQTTHAWS